MEIKREFIHGKKFDYQWSELGLDDNAIKDLQAMLLENPKLGSVIKGTGRLRKMRYSYGNRGKSHCARVCYADFEKDGIVFLIMIFAKNEMENLSSAERNDIKILIERLEDAFRKRR